HQSYFVADGNNYVTADIVYNSSLQYYSRTAVTTSGPCYVKVSEDTYELATEGGADKYYLYSDGNYVAAPTNYYTDDGNGTYVKVEYWTAAGITYYTFAKTTVSSSARQSNVLFGECSICHKNGPIIFYYDGNTTANDLRTYLGSGYTVNSLSSSGTITIEGVAYSVLSVRQSSQNRYVLGLQQTGHQLYYDWLDAEKNIHEGKCGDCTSNSGNVSGTHTFTSTAKYVCHNHSAAGKVKYDNVLALQCSVCENYYIWCLNIDDSTTMSGLSALTEAKGYSVVGFTGSDLVSERLNALTEYGTIENAYLVPVCPTGETDATGYVLVTITHAFTCTYENVTYHKKVCSVCGYEERITHTVGQTIKDANDVLGYVCADCGEFIPYHFVMDHLNIIAEFNGLLPEGWQSVETETSKKFYVYMDSHTFTTCELTLLYDGVNDTVLTHILVPVKGNNDETGYVAVYFIPHTMVYDVLGDTDFYDGIFTTKHRAHCTEPDCGKAYEGDHVFDGTYHLEMNSALGVMILTQTCIFCEQKVAVKYTFDDTTRYNAFNALLQPYGYTYYKTSSSVTGSNLVVYEQFSGKGGDYNTSVDVDGDGLDDYFIVEIAEKDNSAQIAGYVLVKFRHHMEYNLSSGDEMDMMVCSVCGYFYTTGHRVAQDRMAIEVGVKKYYYDEADNVEATTTSDAFVTYGDNKKVLMFCFGPDTTIDEVTQYFIGMASFTLYGQYQYKTHGYVCRSGRYIVGIEEKDGRKYLDDWKITQGVFTEYFYQGEFYYRLPLCEARCLFGYNSTDGYTGELEFVLDSEGEPLRVDISGPQFYLLAKYDPNAPKDGYFMYYSRESGNQLVEVASYRELAREDYMRFVNDSEYELATDTINYDEKEYAAITQAETKESAVFYYNDNTKIDDLTGYLIGRTAWSGPNNRGVVTASGFIATGTFGSSATIASLEGDWETLTEGGKTYYIIPLYSHADSTIKYDDYGRFDGTNCTINGISTDPAMYILACKDTTAPDYGYFKKLESDTAIEIASYQNAKAEVLLSNLLDPNSINRNEGDDATLEFTDFFVKASVNGDENILRYIVGLGTTLTDVINDLPDFTYYHDGVLGTGTDNLALLIASYLKDNYYNALTAKLRFGSHRTQYFLPLAYKNAPDVWVANLWLEIELEDMRRQEQVYVKEQGAIIADYEAVFVGLKCSGCQEAAYVEREVTTTTTFAELEQYITIVDYLFDYLTGGDFAAADWSELYYHDGCTANSLLDDPAMVKNARYYNILDTMEYGVYDRHNVCLILLGRMTYEEAGVFTELPVYLLLHIAENN
ncbi:MAG: hypothetical protein J5781_04875, partial [Clostridia bacterium]|nr:hypothetical protein [Clostridia bacterium]